MKRRLFMERATPSKVEKALEKYITDAKNNYLQRTRTKKGKFLAHTTEKRTGFNPIYSNGRTDKGYRTFLSKSGLHKEIEALMINNPGKRLPTKMLKEKYGGNKGWVVQIARTVEKAHNLPLRKRGAQTVNLIKNLQTQ